MLLILSTLRRILLTTEALGIISPKAQVMRPEKAGPEERMEELKQKSHGLTAHVDRVIGAHPTISHMKGCNVLEPWTYAQLRWRRKFGCRKCFLGLLLPGFPLEHREKRTFFFVLFFGGCFLRQSFLFWVVWTIQKNDLIGSDFFRLEAFFFEKPPGIQLNPGRKSQALPPLKIDGWFRWNLLVGAFRPIFRGFLKTVSF